MSEYEFTDDWDAFWNDDAARDRDEQDLHLRHVEDEERDRLERDVGEVGPKGMPA